MVLAIALLGMIVLFACRPLVQAARHHRGCSARRRARRRPPPRRHVRIAIAVLLALIFSKYFYLASLSSYYTFYLIDRFHVSVRNCAAATCSCSWPPQPGRHDRRAAGRSARGQSTSSGPRYSACCRFTLLLPHANLFWTAVLTVPIGLILSSAFPAIVVYAQELLPGRIGTIAGLFFGFAFGMGSVGAAVLGALADHVGIAPVYQLRAFLPIIGLFAAFLPDLHQLPPPRAG